MLISSVEPIFSLPGSIFSSNLNIYFEAEANVYDLGVKGDWSIVTRRYVEPQQVNVDQMAVMFAGWLVAMETVLVPEQERVLDVVRTRWHSSFLSPGGFCCSPLLCGEFRPCGNLAGRSPLSLSSAALKLWRVHDKKQTVSLWAQLKSVERERERDGGRSTPSLSLPWYMRMHQGSQGVSGPGCRECLTNLIKWVWMAAGPITSFINSPVSLEPSPGS